MHFKRYTLKFAVSCARRPTFVHHGEVNLLWTSQEKHLRLLLSMSSKETVMATLYKETAACIDISVENMRKARFIFNYINAETYIIPKEDMLQKKLQITSGGSQERSEVVINYNKPLQLKYYKNSEVLSVHTFPLWLLEFFWNTTTLNPVELMGICHLMSVVHAHFLL